MTYIYPIGVAGRHFGGRKRWKNRARSQQQKEQRRGGKKTQADTEAFAGIAVASCNASRVKMELTADRRLDDKGDGVGTKVQGGQARAWSGGSRTGSDSSSEIGYGYGSG